MYIACLINKVRVHVHVVWFGVCGSMWGFSLRHPAWVMYKYTERRHSGSESGEEIAGKTTTWDRVQIRGFEPFKVS